MAQFSLCIYFYNVSSSEPLTVSRMRVGVDEAGVENLLGKRSDQFVRSLKDKQPSRHRTSYFVLFEASISNSRLSS